MRVSGHSAILLVIALFVAACGGGGGGAPTPPRATAASFDLNEDANVSGTLTGVAGEGGSLGFAVRSNPSNGSLSVNAADFTYTPTPDFNGTDSFSFTVSESGRVSAPATVTLNIAAVNDAPVSADSTETILEDNILVASLNATDIDGDTLLVTIETQPTNGTATIDPGVAVDYRPAANFFGQDSFQYSVSDGTVASAVATVTVNVTPVNDPPFISDRGVFNLVAGTFARLDVTGNDIEGETLSYRLDTEFTQLVLSNDPTDSGLLEVDVAYGLWGSDQAVVIANDGTDDSLPADIDVSISPPATTWSLDVRTYDGEFNLNIGNAVEGPNDLLFVIGNVAGEIENPSTGSDLRQFVAIHDETGARVRTEYLGADTLVWLAAGIESGGFYALGVDNVYDSTVRLLSLDANYNPDLDVDITLPYAATRANQQHRPIHVPGVGFYIIGNDNQVSWVDLAGTRQSTTPVPAPLSDTVVSYEVNDVNVSPGSVRVSGGMLVCSDAPTECFVGIGALGYLLTLNDAGVPLSVVQLPGFPHDSVILEDGSVAAHIGETLYRVDTDGTVLWQRQLIGATRGYVGTDGTGDIYWWAYNETQASYSALRLAADNTLRWQTDNPLVLLGQFRPGDMAVDEYGNLFISYIDRYVGSGSQAGRMNHLHIDYSGNEQWKVVSEPSDLGANTTYDRVSLLTSDYRFVSTAEDFIPGGGPDNDGFIFINTVRPAPP